MWIPKGSALIRGRIRVLIKALIRALIRELMKAIIWGPSLIRGNTVYDNYV